MGVSTVGNRVRALREGQLLTREEFAKRAKVSLRTIYAIEHEHPIRMATKRAVVRALGYAYEERERVFPPIEEEGS